MWFVSARKKGIPSAPAPGLTNHTFLLTGDTDLARPIDDHIESKCIMLVIGKWLAND